MIRNRMLSVLLCFALVISLLPGAVFAENNGPVTEIICTQGEDCPAEVHSESCLRAAGENGADTSKPAEVNSKLTEDPSDPLEDPSDPSEDPSDPSEDSSDPSEDSSDPSEDPSDPSEDPSDPSEDPSDPSEDPSRPEEGTVQPTAAEQVQSLINNLPEADTITAENAEDVKTQLTAIDEAKNTLTDEERDGLDISRYMAAVAALSALDGMAGADTPKTLETLVTYLDAAGTTQTRDSATAVTNTTTTLNDGWYVVNSDVTVASRITVTGGVHLILKDGCSLTANQGIKVSSGNGFTVYSQSMGADMGRLTAKPTGCNAGIGSNMNEGCGTVVINGGRIDAQAPASYGEPAGIGGGGYGAAGTVIINNGVVNATGCGKGIGGWGTSGTISIRGGIVTSNGIGTGGYGESHQTSISDNSVVISSGAINKANQGSWSGVVIEKGTGKVYGGTVTLPMDVTLPEGTTLTIPEGATLAAGTGVTLTNNGAIYMDGGALNAAVTGKIYYPLTVTNGMASPTSSLNGKTFAQAGGTVTLTADPAVGKTASWTCVSGDVTVTDNTFTMPSNAAAVEAVYVNAPAYTVTIPTEVTVGKTATVSVTAAVAEDYCLEVGIDNAEHRFVMTSEEGATLAYAVSDGSKQVNPGGSILLVEGGAEKNATATLDFRLTQDAQYAGSYKDTVIFTVSVKEKP